MALLLASLLPLSLLGLGAWVVLGRLVQQKILEHHGQVVATHSAVIEHFLEEHVRALELAAGTHRLEDLSDPARLEALLEVLNDRYGEAFVDLGVITEEGVHAAYVGPYELSGRDYSEAEWFRAVTAQGRYVSDLFLGYRGVPHLVIAVRQREGSRSWILRATLNSDRFTGLVRTEGMGATFDAYLVNGEGRYQTPPRRGAVLALSPLRPRPHRGVAFSRWQSSEGELQLTTTWLNDGRWQLVVQQQVSEAEAPLRRALWMGVLVVALAFAVTGLSTTLATRHLVGQIEVAQKARDDLARELLRSAQLATVGEMATGLAHEINNPLAIISAEQTNLGDMVSDLPEGTAERESMLSSIGRCRRQVARCGAITAKMLQFGRQAESRPRLVSPREHLEETATLLRRRASEKGVELRLELAGELPLVRVDPIELEQVVTNLINNAIHAAGRGGRVTLAARRTLDELLVEVRDTGEGIAPEIKARIFEPFFTTKPVGEGTGLGLSVCYGLVQRWGGVLRADSEVGQGATLTFTVPAAEERRGQERAAARHREEAWG